MSSARFYGREQKLLKKNGIDYEFVPDFLISKIVRNLQNVRITGVMSDTNIRSIVWSLKDGLKLEPVIVGNNGGGSYSCIDGHHRLEAYDEMDISTTDALVCKNLSPSVLEMLQREANYSNGEGSTGHRLPGVIALLDSDPTMSIEEVAGRAGVPVTTVKAHLRTRYVQAALKLQGFDCEAKNLKEGYQHVLHQVIKRPAALAGAASIMGEYSLTIPEARKLSNELRDAPDDKAVADVLAEARMFYKGRPGQIKPRVTVLSKVLQSATSLRNQFNTKNFGKNLNSHLSDSGRLTFRRDIKETVACLNQMLNLVLK